MTYNVTRYFQILPSSVTVQSKSSPLGTEFSLKFDYYHPPTAVKVEMQPEIGHIYGQ